MIPIYFSNTKNKHQSGFTIVELLIVIVVIAILAAISIVAYNGIQQRGRDGQRKADISTIKKALEMYRLDNNTYPSCVGTASSCLTTALIPKYINRFPSDPSDTAPYNYMYAAPYRKTGSTTYEPTSTDNYILGIKLETITSPTYGGWDSNHSTMTWLEGSSN